MRIFLVYNAPWPLVNITTRFEPYVEGLRQLGAQVLTLCPAGTEAGYPYPVRTFADEAEIARPDYWRAAGCDAVAVMTWLRMTNILTAAKEAGSKVLAIAESDAQIRLRSHPWETFRFMTCSQPTLRGKLGAAKYWLTRYLFRAGAEGRYLVENIAAADVTTFSLWSGAETFAKVLRDLGAGELACRLSWVPYPIPEEFCAGPVATSRVDRLVAVGRWDAEQKNAPLLAGVARRLAKLRPQTQLLIVGGGGERFASLARSVSTVKVLGRLPRDVVRGLMAESRAVLIPSRWESGPIVAWESLVLGGTVVGTPILNLAAITQDGRFGRVSRDHSPDSLAAAASAELAAWDSGGRSPAEIAEHWRSLVSPAAVGGRMLSLLGLRPGAAPRPPRSESC